MTGRLWLAACALFAAQLFVAHAATSEAVPTKEPLSAFPRHIGDWNGTEEPAFDDATMRVLGVDDYLNVTYARPRQLPVGLYVGYYGSQRQGHTIHSPLNCLPGAGWQPVTQGRVAIAVPDFGGAAGGPRPIEVNRYVVQKGLDRLLVLYWYQAHGRVVPSEYWTKFYLIADAMRLNRTDGALVRVISQIPDRDGLQAGPGEQQAVDFIKDVFPLLGRYLPA